MACLSVVVLILAFVCLEHSTLCALPKSPSDGVDRASPNATKAADSSANHHPADVRHSFNGIDGHQRESSDVLGARDKHADRRTSGMQRTADGSPHAAMQHSTQNPAHDGAAQLLLTQEGQPQRHTNEQKEQVHSNGRPAKQLIRTGHDKHGTDRQHLAQTVGEQQQRHSHDYQAASLLKGRLHLAAMTNSSVPHLHFHRYHPEDAVVVGKPGGYYHKMRRNESAFAYSTDELLSRPYCGQLRFNSSLEGRWYQDSVTGHYLYEPDACRLRRLSSAESHACLRGKRLVMLGDSVTRYQYTSLINFLASGGYQNPYDDGALSVSNVDHWNHSYSRLYNGVTKKVSALFNGRGNVTCNCDKTRYFEEWYLTLDDGPTLLDYKYVFKRPSWAAAGIHALDWALRQHATNTSAAAESAEAGGALMAAGAARRHLHSSLDELVGDSSTTAAEVPPSIQPSLDIRYPVSRKHAASIRAAGKPTLRQLQKKKKKRSKKKKKKKELGTAKGPLSRPLPDMVVMNMCAFWGRTNGDGLVLRMATIFRHGEMLMERYNREGARKLQLVWKSCTVKSSVHQETAAQVDALALQHGWQVLNVREVVNAARRQGLTITWAPAAVHFVQLAYETMNDMLLNILCPVQDA